MPDLWPQPRQSNFWRHVKQLADDDCWPWTGSHGPSGVGRYHFRADGRHLTVYAPRTAFILARGPIPPSFDVFHRLPGRNCCNPRHLAAAKVALRTTIQGLRAPSGSRHHAARLRASEIAAIRRAQGRVDVVALSERYGVSRSRIRDVWARRSWRNTP